MLGSVVQSTHSHHAAAARRGGSGTARGPHEGPRNAAPGRTHATPGPPPTMPDSRPPRSGPAWLAGLAVFVLAALALHLLRPDLDPVRHQMSLYLIGPWGPLLQGAYLALAMAMLGLAWGLYRSAPRRRAAPRHCWPSRWRARGSTTAYAWMDIPGTDRTLEGLVHGISAQGAFLFATTGLVLRSLRLRHDPRWRAPARWLLPWALACRGGLGAGVVARTAAWLAQKAVIAMIVGWLAATAGLLLARSRPRRPARTRPPRESFHRTGPHRLKPCPTARASAVPCARSLCERRIRQENRPFSFQLPERDQESSPGGSRQHVADVDRQAGGSSLPPRAAMARPPASPVACPDPFAAFLPPRRPRRDVPGRHVTAACGAGPPRRTPGRWRSERHWPRRRWSRWPGRHARWPRPRPRR